MEDPSWTAALFKRASNALEKYFKKHEPAIERWSKRMDFFVFLCMWPFIYLSAYALFAAVALCCWYGVSRAAGLNVPPGNLLRAAWAYYQSPIPHTVILIGAFFIVAVCIYILRTSAR